MENEPGRSKSDEPKTILKRSWGLFSATEDQLFSALLPFSFLVLVVLAFIGRGTEMAVFAGFTAICMAFLKLDKFSEFSGIGFSAKLHQVEKKVEAMEARETEVDPDEVSWQFGSVSSIEILPAEKKVLKAIESSKFTFRTASGISQNLKIDSKDALQVLKDLEGKGLVSKIVTSRRTEAWNITDLGRAYLAHLPNE